MTYKQEARHGLSNTVVINKLTSTMVQMLSDRLFYGSKFCDSAAGHDFYAKEKPHVDWLDQLCKRIVKYSMPKMRKVTWSFVMELLACT